ncbi:MAG: ketoacyl-ACP synthase III [Alphaproteobacteria bacterium]|nr:ketoacyl-ACP synthase III [Alphaproteobacteria bacterium]
MTLIRSQLIGFGHYLPSKILTNDDLAQIVETNDEWIRTRTGIVSRHISDGESTSDMAFKAAQMAIQTAGISVEELDMIIMATVTPDNTTPSVAAKLSNRLGAKFGTICMDISAACSGFVYALTIVDNMIRLGQVKTALVIGGETISKVLDWSDRNTCVLFGDAAGAAIVRAGEGNGTAEDTGILATKLYADGSHYDSLKITGGVSTTQTAGVINMDGKEVFKFAVNALSQASEEVMAMAGVTSEQVDWVLPHQANIRIIEGVGKKLAVPDEKVIVTVDHHGNTSAASIPIALSENYQSGRIKKGDLLVLSAMGAGFTWGGALVRL